MALIAVVLVVIAVMMRDGDEYVDGCDALDTMDAMKIGLQMTMVEMRR